MTQTVSRLATLTGDAGPDAKQRWRRQRVDAAAWEALCADLGAGLDLVSLWGEPGAVHMAVREGDDAAIVTLSCPTGRYPSVGRRHPPAVRLERALQDLTGLAAEGLPDARPWLDHGRWGVRHPLWSAETVPADGAPYAFLPVEGEGLHQIPVGPVHAGVIEPGHFRFTVNGETVVRLEQRLGYAHKGTVALMSDAPLAHAARLAGRISGDSTAAYALAFALAVESATASEVPERARWLRGLMAELERLANHLGDIGAVANDAAFAILHAHTGVLREQVLRASDTAFGHRLMMDRIVPGGVWPDLTAQGHAAITAAVGHIRRVFPNLVTVYDETNSLQDRVVGAGVVRPEWVDQFAAGGFVGRASGRAFDARLWAAYAPYPSLRVDPPVFDQGDVNARVWVRIREVEQSLALIDRLLETLPSGPILAPLTSGPQPQSEPVPEMEGAALVESFRGDVFFWVRVTAGGRVAACHFRDPSWFQWPLLEAAIEANIVADFPLCNKSFNCAYSGHDG
ncbi:NADH-quinone oxidoreductase subunit C [Brevundimonas sp.]|uniref:hydrogenase large subunit n=2 Tax=Brevundimonas sp. TaxID=1871086 RepID=UPI0027EE99E5|nr:NADH-quinone oxidoreductase subunit C [Brevundimonas sp.]MDQ7813492.1 NADH-quinone oxidoreductase subunit C [Brevundimonas sp.]